jgi:gliding motility-associated-like protein
LTGDITVESTGPVAVGLFGSSSDAGWSGYYSGFSLNTNAAFDAPSTVCSGDEAFIQFAGDTLGGGVLNWNFGGLEATPLGDDLFEVSTESPGDYTVYLDVQGDLCSDTTTHVVTFYPPYSGNSVANACGEYTWNGIEYNATGVYNDVLTSATGCDSLVELTLDIMSIPDPMMSDYADDTLVYCPAPGSLLFGQEADPIYQIQWTHYPPGTSDTILLTDLTNAVPYVGPGLYQIDYFTGPPCNFGASGFIDVEIEDCSIVIPNVFSPNGDGKNDRFLVSGLYSIEGVRMQIFNRWGNLLFSDVDFGGSAGWDPRDDASEGTYYFILNIPVRTEELTITTAEGTEILEGGTDAEYFGHFTLVR